MIQLKITPPAIPFNLGTSIVARVRARFMQEAGTLLLDAIRAHLGQDSIYTLSPEYAQRKPKLAKFRRMPGKSSTQPLILSAEMFNALTVIPDGDGFRVQLEDGQAIDNGFDYGEFWQEIVDYLGLGLADVEAQLPEVLGDIIVQEMGL